MKTSDTAVTKYPGERFKSDVPPGKPQADKGLVSQILVGATVSPAVLRAWRLSMRMSVANLARVLHLSRRHMIRLEKGDQPLNEHFLTRLREFVIGLPDPLPEVPYGIAQRPRAPLNTAEVWVPLNKLAAKGHWRTCAGCQQLFLFTDARKLYHSRKCKDAAEKRGESVGVAGNTKPDAQKRRRYFRCPDCGHIHLVAGNVVRPEELARLETRNVEAVDQAQSN